MAAGITVPEFKRAYTDITKKVLLTGIELERFSLNYRLESARQPKYRLLRYIAAQEAGAACGMVFEIIGVREFNIGKSYPLRVDVPALKNGLTTAMIGSIIAGSSSCFELGSNLLTFLKHKKQGIDSHSANKYVAEHLKRLDDLLDQREALIAAHKDNPVYDRAVLEGKILREMRQHQVLEFSHFNADGWGFHTYQNLFFALNAAYSTVGALGAAYARKAATQPKFNTAANVLFMVNGAMAGLSPVLSTVASKIVNKRVLKSNKARLNADPNFSPDTLTTNIKLMENYVSAPDVALIPSLPATQRLALYAQADDNFRKQLDNETNAVRHLEKIALQSVILGPPIGATFMTQGILYQVAYKRYTVQPKQQLGLFYTGAIVGLAGAGTAVVGNVGFLLSAMAYRHKLEKGKRLPAQLIQERLQHLDDCEKLVNAL